MWDASLIEVEWNKNKAALHRAAYDENIGYFPTTITSTKIP